MAHTNAHSRGNSKFKNFVRSVLRFVLEYGWLFFGWTLLTSILFRAGMGFFAVVVLLVWALGVKSSQTSDGGEVLKDFLSHVPAWLLQHVVAFFALMNLTRLNWSGGSVIGLVICITGPMLLFFQLSRWYIGRGEKLTANARADEVAASHVEELERLEAHIRAQYEAQA